MTNPAVQAQAQAPLSQELSDFLIEFAISLHRTAMYPQGHPSMEHSATLVVTRLAALLLDRTRVAIGVAGRQLVIDGVAMDPRHPVLRSLAAKLHRHQLGAIVMERGLGVDEVVAMLRLIAIEQEDGALPLGLGDPAVLRQWQHVRLHPLTYEQLELAREGEDEDGEEPETHLALLWMGLARAALAMGDQDVTLDAAEAAVVADALNQHPPTKAYDQVVVGYLHQLAQELRADGGLSSNAVRKRLSRLVGALDERTLGRLLDLGGDVAQRRRVVLDATEVLAADAVVDLVRAAAATSKQTISDSMVRLLTKLSAFAEQGPPLVQAQADNALREQVQHLVEGWEVRDPIPDAYDRALSSLARRGLTLTSTARTDYLPEPLRVVEMTLELDCTSLPFWRAVAEVLEHDGAAALVGLLVEMPAGNGAVRALWQHLAKPEQARRLLAGGTLDFRALDPIFDRMEPALLAPLLLDLLIEAEGRGTRLAAFKRLAAMDLPTVEPHLVRGLQDERWYVQRNMLALINEMGVYSEAVSPSVLARHNDPRVRREALVLWMRSPRERDRALYLALADQDERALRAGVAEAQKGVPEVAVQLIARRALEPLPPDLCAGLLQLLRGKRHRLAFDALMRAAGTGRGFLGRYRLAPKSAATLAALAVLADTWSTHPRAAALLARARAADDPEIRSAAQAPGHAA